MEDYRPYGFSVFRLNKILFTISLTGPSPDVFWYSPSKKSCDVCKSALAKVQKIVIAAMPVTGRPGL
jgi:hypothetical protein